MAKKKFKKSTKIPTRKVSLTKLDNMDSGQKRGEIIGWETSLPQKGAPYQVWLHKGLVLTTSPVQHIKQSDDVLIIRTLNSIYQVQSVETKSIPATVPAMDAAPRPRKAGVQINTGFLLSPESMESSDSDPNIRVFSSKGTQKINLKEEIELRAGEFGEVCNGTLCISPAEVGIELVHMKIGRSEFGTKEVTITRGDSVTYDAGSAGKFGVRVHSIKEGNLLQDIPASAKVSVRRL
jgi:hypothetical protein